MTEEQLQAECVTWLRRAYPSVLTVPGKTSTWSPQHTEKIKMQGYSNKNADLFILHNDGVFSMLCIEFKKPGKILYNRDGSPRAENNGHFKEQLKVHEYYRKQKYRVEVVQSLTHFQRICNEHLRDVSRNHDPYLDDFTPDMIPECNIDKFLS